LDSGGNPELSHVNDDDKAAVTDLFAESTASSPSTTATASSEPPVVVPLQLHGAGDKAKVVLETCLPPPIIYSKTVHEPVTVSAGEFARALSGAVVVHSMEPAVLTGGSDTERIPQSLEGTENASMKPAKQVEIKPKRRGCC